jgi:outer membrane protein assembly factor BamB
MKRCRTLIAVGAVLATACSSGNDPPKCKFGGQTVLADPAVAAWPKAGRDMANTGRIAAPLRANPGTRRWKFPADDVNVGPITASPLVGKNDQILLVGNSFDPKAPTAKLYVLQATDGSTIVAFDTTTTAGAISTPVLGEDGTVFMGFTDGGLRQLETVGDDEHDPGEVKNTSFLSGLISGSPNIGTDGTIYVGSLSGFFSAVCPNGVPRFTLVTAASRAAPAVASDRTIITAADDGQVRAVDIKGRQQWAFFTSAAVLGAIVLDEPDGRLFVADHDGRAFAVRLADGTRIADFQFDGRVCSATAAQRCQSDRQCPTGETCLPSAPISASPALGTATLYVAAENGRLYALDPDSGTVRWSFALDSGQPIRSSPAVATDDAGEVIVFGADDGQVYAVADGPSGPTVLWSFAVDAADGPIGRSSPSIGFDGTVYIGTEGGHLYAIGAPAPPTATPTATPPLPTPTATATPG